jgi:hypothetical protein
MEKSSIKISSIKNVVSKVVYKKKNYGKQCYWDNLNGKEQGN